MHHGPYAAVAIALITGVYAGCTSVESDAVEFRNVDPICVESPPADDEWVCESVRTISCEEAANADIPLHVEVAAGACDATDLQGVLGPFGPGEHEIEIEDDASGEVVCTATLEVTDDEAPVVETQEVNLWPPNHKFHEVSLEDCIEEIDECDEDWTARIIAVSSDEPTNANGDGNTEADIAVVDDQTVSVRSERQGGSNGRVYTVDFEVEDGSGNITEASCFITVVHDQSGAAAIDDGPAYTVTWP